MDNKISDVFGAKNAEFRLSKAKEIPLFISEFNVDLLAILEPKYGNISKMYELLGIIAKDMNMEKTCEFVYDSLIDESRKHFPDFQAFKKAVLLPDCLPLINALGLAMGRSMPKAGPEKKTKSPRRK